MVYPTIDESDVNCMQDGDIVNVDVTVYLNVRALDSSADT